MKIEDILDINATEVRAERERTGEPMETCTRRLQKQKLEKAITQLEGQWDAPTTRELLLVIRALFNLS